MQGLAVWKHRSSKDNLAFAAVLGASLGLAVAGAAVQAMEVQTLLQVVLQAAASAARILG
ncbi:MAG: hypothetical protein HYZ17_04735 [Betaproteobacteria bacterium]|nr:hypothetical protein [Betaproteobacteria bacterium]